MPDEDGIEATRKLSASKPDIAVLMLTMHEDDESVFVAMRAGASGYILKGAEPEEVVGAIKAVTGERRSSDLPSRGGSSGSSRPPTPWSHFPSSQYGSERFSI